MPAPWDWKQTIKDFSTPGSVVGESRGNKVWSGSGWIDPPNPQDPQQTSQWGVNAARGVANQPLYSEEQLKKLQSIFGPYFASQRGNLARQMSQDRASAGRQGGAFAAAQGLANPGAYTSSAMNRVNEAYAPQFGNLQTNQLGTLLNAAAGSSQFGAQNQLALAQMLMNQSQQQQQLQDRPGFWDYLGGGLIGGLGAFAGGLGGGLGKKLAG